MNNKNISILSSVLIGTFVVGCGGGSSSSPSDNQSPNISKDSIAVPMSNQVATYSSIYNKNKNKSTQSVSLLSNANNCFALVDQGGKNYLTDVQSTQWWSTAKLTFAIKNTCNSPQAMKDVKVIINGLLMNGIAVNELGDISQSGSGAYLSVSKSGTSVIVNTPACEGDWCSWAQIPAGATKTLAVNNTFGGAINSFTASSVVIDGSQPDPIPPGPVVTTGEFTLKINANDLRSTCTSTYCQAEVSIGVPSGQSPLDKITFNPATTQIVERTYSNLLPGNYTLQVNNANLPKGTTFDYGTGTGTVSVIADTKSSAAVNFKYSEVATLSDVNLSVAGIADLNQYTQISSIEADVTDEKTGKVYKVSLPLAGGSVNLQGLPTADSYTIKSQSIANPTSGVFYQGVDLAGVTFKEGSNSLPLTFTKVTTIAPKTLEFNLTGLDSATATVPVLLADTGEINPGFYIYTPASVKTGDKLKFIDGTVAINVTEPAGYTLSDYQKVIDKSATINLSFTKNVVPSISYNYEVWFKDYNNKFDISVNGVNSAKSIVFTSNAKLSSSLWGTCFGQTLTNDMAKTAQVTNGYQTTLTAASGSFDLTKQCTLMYDDKTSEVLPGSGGAAHNMMITSMIVDGVDAPIYQPCAATGCKDPGNGYVNAGYYAQWAVWGRKYNPNNMPFDSINDIIYAFIGFEPATGNIKTLDSSADTWGLSATSRAMMQYPYMHAHLSFGGWTNNGVNTAPMFQQLSSSSTSMQNFAKQAVALMQKNKFTGIDIDWEWWSDYTNAQAPAKQMLAFYKVLRNELDIASKADGKKYTLTIAVNGGVDRVNAMQNTAVNPNAVANFWAQVNGLIDQVNIMSYDYHGAYDQDAAYFHANYTFANVPVNKQAAVGQPTGWSIKDAVAAYQANGIAAKKLVVGLPIYARTMKVANNTDGGLLQPVLGAGFGDYENGILDYKCLINPVADPVNGCGLNVAPSDTIFYNVNATGAVLDSFNKYGRDALQPWGYSPSTNTFVTFDDVWSVKAKTQKVIDGNLGGTMFWELDGDSTDANKSLIKAVSGKYQGK